MTTEMSFSHMLVAQSAEAIEYTNWFSAEGKTPNPQWMSYIWHSTNPYIAKKEKILQIIRIGWLGFMAYQPL